MKYIYIIGGLFFIMIPLITLNNDLDYYQVEKSGKIVEMTIIRIPGSCLGTKNPYFMTCQYMQKNYEKRIGGNFCETHAVGNKISMKYLEGSEKIMFPKESQISEFFAGVLLGIFGIFLCLFGFGFFPKMRR